MTGEWRSAAGWAAEAKALGVDPKTVMPHTKAGVIAKANRESWPFRERAKGGGGREYPLSGLPKAFRVAILNSAAHQIAATLPLPLCAISASSPPPPATGS